MLLLGPSVSAALLAGAGGAAIASRARPSQPPPRIRPLEMVAGVHTHSRLHHIDVPPPVALSPELTGLVRRTRMDLSDGPQMQAMDPIDGAYTHSQMHHIDVPKVAPGAALEAEAEEDVPEAEERVAEGGEVEGMVRPTQTDQRAAPQAQAGGGVSVVGAHTHQQLHHIDVPPTAASRNGRKGGAGKSGERRLRKSDPVNGAYTHGRMHHIDVDRAR